MPKRKPIPKRRNRPPAKLPRVPDELRSVLLTAEIATDDWAHLTAAEGEAARIPSFTMTAYSGGIMRPNLSVPHYGRGVVLDLSGFRAAGSQIPIDFHHDNRDPVGHSESVEFGSTIKATGVLSVPGESRDKIVGAARNGFRWKPSVDVVADLQAIERVLPDQIVKVNGRTLRGPFLLFRRGVVRAITFTTIAGDPTASATVRASLLSDTAPMDFEAWLKAQGITDAATLTDAGRATLQAAYDAQVDGDDDEPGDDPPPDPKPKKVRVTAGDANPPAIVSPADHVAEMNRQLAANTERVGAIVTLCAGAANPTIKVGDAEVSLQAHAIAENWTRDQTELHILRNHSPRGPAIHSRSASDTVNVQAMTGAMLMAGGIALDNASLSDAAGARMGVPAYLRASVNDDARQQAMDAAHQYGAVDLLAMAADCIRLDGGHPPRNREALIQAAASSATLTQVYAHTVGASLLVGYRSAPRTLDRWSTADEVSDFKRVQRFRDDANQPLAHKPRGAEADHDTEGAEFEYLAVDSYARQWEICREDYIDNNLGIVSRKPMKMGEAAYKTEENLGYAVLISNPTLNSTGRALFNTTDNTLHAGRALSRANASYLLAQMAAQMHGDENLDLEIGWALMPHELRDSGVQIFNSPTIGEDGGQGTRNVIADYAVQVVASGRLSNGVTNPKTKVFHAGSATSYYLVARNTDAAVRVYLSGSGRVPMVRVTQLTQGRWGTHIDVLHDVGFGFVSPLAIFKATV